MKNAAYFFVVAISVIAALIYGQSLIVPFILGMLLWFIMRSVKALLNKIDWMEKRVPSWIKTLLSSGLIAGILVALFSILSHNITNLTQAYPKYESNVETVVASINETFDLNIVETSRQQIGDLDFGKILSSVLNSLSGLIGNSFMMIIYALFILLEESNFTSKMKAIFIDPGGYDEFTVLMNEVESSIAEYFRLKALMSLITGVLSYLVLWWIGVDSPAFWAFLIFVLNFIPTVGSLVGTIFPAIFALLQFGELLPFILVLAIVGSIQVLVGNVLEPRLMGSSMNISPLVTILALSIWGAIWGVIGMILSVPITVVMIIIFSRFEKTRAIAILLSEKGELNLGKD